MTIAHSTLTGADLHDPGVHATSHKTGGSDEVLLDELGDPTDNTALDATSGAHGLCPKLSGSASDALLGDGTWGIVGGAPPGAVVMWMTDTVPSGWLECNGASVTRSGYANLFTAIGTKYGNADGSHFNLPDMRGYFPRGWDHARGVDPNAATRTNRGDGTTGDHTGTRQAMAVLLTAASLTLPALLQTPGSSPSYSPFYGVQEHFYGPGGEVTPGDVTITVDLAGGAETRPVNINVMFIIKT
jgi:hypothetical protein